MSSAKVVESLEDLKALLDRTKTIAVVGLSEKPERDSHSISRYLKEQGYRIIGINPVASTILGEPSYPSLSAIPEDLRRQVDLVAVFRKAGDVPAILEEASRLGLKRAWLPAGASSPSALQSALGLGLTVVADKCLRVVHEVTRSPKRK
jgi:hypothetical protein